MEENKKIVVFTVDGESFGADILEVSEIIRMEKITPLPQSAEFVEGVINLRGELCTILNLRKRLGYEPQANNDDAKIIVVSEAQSGLIVDSVTEIINVQAEDIKPIDSIDLLKNGGIVDYLVQSNDRITSVLKMDEILKGTSKEKQEEVA
ncbi:chemotaxis protein CheW (plasmid) [Aneurinibacillus sp. Ricciae_BoGa-3]|uniref:chemotaxis protein CheW n=1 Tax=Aneurinibacillus sp. Ricciae_BoGa-3 TaxID=3022697 RepID=UPI0023416568|nr:chemotaxis protein CheW [Aneurinibacillus sp. Ricciae_BoGa-3]WCK57278.1 chemotaxis protein CheW [Aneurinibacillus sp. Ricciae_BoGa-3]